MELEQLIPERQTWIKKITTDSGESSIEFAFRPFCLEDEAFLKRTFGDSLKEKLEQMDVEAISRIAFHQLEPGSKRDLMKIKFLDISEDGEEIEIAKTGPQKLGRFIVGYSEQFELLKILLKVRGFSMPIIEELSKEIEDGLGNLKAQERK